MGTLDTKLLIADALIELSTEQPLRKVSISDIVKRTGKNRKTFYYHFEDKDALIIWKFRYDLDKALTEQFPAAILTYGPVGTVYADMSFYITQKSGVRSLNHAAFFEVFAGVLQANRSFYTQAFAEDGPTSLKNYLHDLYTPALRRDIDIILSNRYLPEDQIEFLSDFYTCAFLSYYIRRCSTPGIKNVAANPGPFANLIHSSLENEITEAQLRRNL